jgi:dipeptidyl aminopeptidase/acylaminoacyl peptidase
MAGISDLKRNFYDDVSQRMIRDSRSLRYDLRYVGAKDLNDKILADRSPALHADQIDIPVLLIHGDNDSVVPFEQSEFMANALKKAGKPYEFVRLKSEDHWLSKADTRLQMLQAVVKFLETNNPP